MVYRRLSSQSLLGGLVVVVGLVLLANTTGVYDTGQLLVYVPSLFVLVGLYAIVASDFRNVGGPAILVAVASAWQLVALDVLAVSQLVQFWPVLLVLFGLSVILGRYRSRVAAVDQSFVSAFAIFGGNEQRVTGDTFTGGDLSTMFGGVELDLRDATVATPPARVNVTALFGGVEIIVPRDWNVQVDVLPVLGGASDDRPRREEEHDTVDLVVTGFVAFGGVEITD